MSLGSEFYVREVLPDSNVSVRAIGIPNRGDPVKIGCTFQFCYQIPRSLDDAINEAPRALPLHIYPICLTVTAIMSYRKFVTILPNGVTGMLYLSGDRCNALVANCYINSSNPFASNGGDLNK